MLDKALSLTHIRKGEEQTSSMIFIIGFIALVAIFVSAAYLGVSGLQTPMETVQFTDGDRDEVAAHLAELSDRCWSQGNEGTSPEVIDCYELTTVAQEEVREEHVLRDLGLDEAHFSMEEPVPANAEATVVVRYQDGGINIRLFTVGSIDTDDEGTSPENGNGVEDVPAAFGAVISDIRDTIDDVLDDVEAETGENLDDVRNDIHDTLDDVENDLDDVIAGAAPEEILARAGNPDPCDIIDDIEDNGHDMLDDMSDRMDDMFDDVRDSIRNADLPQDVEDDALDRIDDAQDDVRDALDDARNDFDDHLDDQRNQHNC